MREYNRMTTKLGDMKRHDTFPQTLGVTYKMKKVLGFHLVCFGKRGPLATCQQKERVPGQLHKA